MPHILSLDQGTTSSRALLVADDGSLQGMQQQATRQIFPNAGAIEHDPLDIWQSQLQVAQKLLTSSQHKVAAIGITNQRETTVIWDKKTAEPIYNAIVWQDQRTSAACEKLITDGYADLIQQKTGLLPAPYFSASKITWILDHVAGARARAERGELAFGTIDSWLVYKLTQGRSHISDVSNASRTLLFDIQRLQWDEELLKIFNIPLNMMPQVVPSSGTLALCDKSFFGYEIPITGIAGDQQAATFGQQCGVGMAKITYGTGCFMLLNTGHTLQNSAARLLTTIGWGISGNTSYCLEGSVFMGGAIIQWLRDGLGIIREAKEVETLANTVPDSGGVVLIPAFTGLGAPHWDSYARGTLFGLHRGSTKAHIAYAALEAIALQNNDILQAMQQDSSTTISSVRVDGGACVNDLLMQLQADILGIAVERPQIVETTALGAAFLAGLGAGIWSNRHQLAALWRLEKRFLPTLSESHRKEKIALWQRAIARSTHWLGE